jgi:MscS family membrane protein
MNFMSPAGSMRFRVFFIFLLFYFFQLPALAAIPQIPGLLPTPAAAPAAAPNNVQPAVPSDPLDRETPRGCVLGFVKAAQDEKYLTATEYFEPLPSRRKGPAHVDDEELVPQLLAILNQKFTGPLNFLSREAQGNIDDGLPPDQEKVGGALGVRDDFPIYLIRLDDQHGRKLWYISRKSLELVPEMYDSLKFPQIEKSIPKVLVVHRFFSMPLWQWLAMLLFVPVAIFFARLFTLAAVSLIRAWQKSRKRSLAPDKSVFHIGPVTVAIAIVLHYIFVSYIGTSLLYRIYYRRVVWILLIFAFYWIVAALTRYLSQRIGETLTRRGMLAERSIVSLLRRLIEVIIFIFVTLAALHSLGLDVTTALAGVGIGGLALGLGAQKTFENMFGGVSILFDKVVQIGDTCKINNQVGVVQDIGLRSTRLRTAERTLLSIPNGIMATVTIENLRFRDKFLCQQIIRLRYDLSPDHVRFVLNEIREILRVNPKVEDSSARARFLRFAEYSLEVELFCYILEPEYTDYLATQEALLLEIMDRLERAGAVVALPTQTTIVTQDSWVQSEKAKIINDAAQKLRDDAKSPPPKP